MKKSLKSKMMAVAAILSSLALINVSAQKCFGDFVLHDSDEIIVKSHHENGTLYDTSSASIIAPNYPQTNGFVDNLHAYNSSSVNISDNGEAGSLYAYNSSTVNISDFGKVKHLYAYNSSSVKTLPRVFIDYLDAYDSSSVNIRNDWIGNVGLLNAHDSSSVDIIGPGMGILNAYDSSSANISEGGYVFQIYAYNSSSVNVFSGGEEYMVFPPMVSLYAFDSSTVKLYGQDFQLGAGLSLDGKRILGTGLLSGEWMNGRPWKMNIAGNDPSATILVPEPATVALLGIGGLVFLRRRRA
jgi:hypothetical protein